MKKTTTIRIEQEILDQALQTFPGRVSKICEGALYDALLAEKSTVTLQKRQIYLHKELRKLDDEIELIVATRDDVKEKLMEIESAIQKSQDLEQRTQSNKDIETIVAVYGLTEEAYNAFKAKFPDRPLSQEGFYDLAKRLLAS